VCWEKKNAYKHWARTTRQGSTGSTRVRGLGLSGLPSELGPLGKGVLVPIGSIDTNRLGSAGITTIRTNRLGSAGTTILGTTGLRSAGTTGLGNTETTGLGSFLPLHHAIIRSEHEVAQGDTPGWEVLRPNVGEAIYPTL